MYSFITTMIKKFVHNNFFINNYYYFLLNKYTKNKLMFIYACNNMFESSLRIQYLSEN